MKKLLILCGVLAPFIYLAAVALGGLLRPGYSHIGQAISELMAVASVVLLGATVAIYGLVLVVAALLTTASWNA